MSLDVGSLVARLTLDDDQYNRSLASGESKFKRLGQSLLATGRLISATWVSSRIVPVINDMVHAASDLGETQSKVNVIFGDAAAGITAFAETAADKIGQSKTAALNAAASFGIFGKAAGLTGEELTKFSSGLVVLSSDLASFGNTSPEAAAEALGAALRGESEPIRTYGVLLNEASIKAKALEMGLLKSTVDINKVKAAQVGAIEAQQKYNKAVKEFGPASLQAQKAQAALGTAQARLEDVTAGTTGEMTQQQRVLAVTASIYDQTKDAQGDFARTSSGLANQERILKARFEDTKAVLGQQLLPIATQFAGVLSETVKWVRENNTWLVPLVGIVGGLAGTVWLIVQAVKAWTAVQWLLNIALDANPIGLIIIAIVALAAGIYLLWTRSAAFRNFFIGMWGAIWGFMKGVGAWFAGPFVGFFTRAWQGITSGFKAAINFLIRAWNALDFGIHVHLPSWLGGYGLDIDDVIPDIPYLAEGGMVRATPGGRLAVLAEGGQDEYALPEDKLRALLAQAAAIGGPGRSLRLHLNIGDGFRTWFRGDVRGAGGVDEYFATVG